MPIDFDLYYYPKSRIAKRELSKNNYPSQIIIEKPLGTQFNLA